MAFNKLTEQYIKERARAKVFERGIWYFKNDQVKKIRLEDNIIYAQVMGNYGLYQVEIEDSDKDFSFQCSCPYEGDFCKHIVAVILAFLGKKDELLKQSSQNKEMDQDLKDKLLSLEKNDLTDLLILSLKTHKDWKNDLFKELARRLSKTNPSSLDNISLLKNIS